jgi:cytochrome d ubiquinol oxidase subunit I
MSDRLDLARVQFALTASVHFLFVIVTLGLVTIVAITQTRFVRTGDPVYERMTRFWGLLYVINYAVGIAVGLVMEFQLGLNWGGLSRLTGDVFGAPLALETLVAFVLESTLLGMWIFGWARLGRRLHLALIWGVAITAYVSAFWVLVANAWLQHPVGYELTADGSARLTSFGALLGNGSLWFALGHVLFAALLTGGFVMIGISAYHVLKSHPDQLFWAKSLRTGVWAAFVGSLFAVGFGFAQFGTIVAYQPTKLGTDGEDELIERFVAQFGPGDYEPPEWIGVPLGFMILIGQGLFFVMLITLPLLYRDILSRHVIGKIALVFLTLMVPLPFAAAILGWLVREVGRQPWAAYGLLKTSDAVSTVDVGALRLSFAGFAVLLVGLAVIDWWLLARHAMRGPGNEFLPAPEEA